MLEWLRPDGRPKAETTETQIQGEENPKARKPAATTRLKRLLVFMSESDIAALEKSTANGQVVSTKVREIVKAFLARG
jgi:hypothetical protein